MIEHLFAAIGTITVATLVVREAHYQWRSRNWKGGPFLGGPWGGIGSAS